MKRLFRVHFWLLWRKGGALACFSERIRLLFKGLTPNANILNDRGEKKNLTRVLPLAQNDVSWNQEYFNYFKMCKSLTLFKTAACRVTYGKIHKSWWVYRLEGGAGLRKNEYALPTNAPKNSTCLFVLGKMFLNEASGLLNAVWHLFR